MVTLEPGLLKEAPCLQEGTVGGRIFRGADGDSRKAEGNDATWGKCSQKSPPPDWLVNAIWLK